MLAVAYAKRPITAKGLVYCDTSFLLDIFAHQITAQGRAPQILPGQTARAQRASQFHEDAVAGGVVFITSIFAVEEAYQVLLFRPILKAATVAGFDQWKKFRAGQPTSFASALEVGRNAVGKFELFLKMVGIDVLQIGQQPYPQAPIIEGQLVIMTKEIIAKYEVEAMDALHYAMILRFKIPLAASSDRDWIQFSRGTLYTDL